MYTKDIENFIKVVDEGITIYKTALYTNKGKSIDFIYGNDIQHGLCNFFMQNIFTTQSSNILEIFFQILSELPKEKMYSESYLAPVGSKLGFTKHKRFALRLKILNNLKAELTKLL